MKSVHTVAWAFFAACVVLIPVAAWRCPLTDLAARYTEDRQPNFDIYLPSWLARYNKEIFGSLYVIGIAWTMIVWLGARAK